MDNLTDVIRTALPRLQAISEQRAQTLSIGGSEMVMLGFVTADSSRHQLHSPGQVWERAQR